MDSEFESMREMLGRLPEEAAPTGFTGRLMEEVQEIGRRRIYRRLVLAMVLRSAVIVGVLLSLLVPVASSVGPGGAGAAWHMVEAFAQAGKWVGAHVYFLPPLLVLFLARRMFAIK
jgi:hypothetical protein